MNKQKEVQPDTIGQQNVPQKKKNIKTTLRNLLALVLVATVSVVGTLAFLNKQTEKVVNTFTGSAGISVTLTEPQWTKDTADNITQGEEMAEQYTPGMKIPKDPTLTNTTTTADSDEWVALRVDYTYKNGASFVSTTRDDLETNLIEQLVIDTDDWYKLPTKTASGNTDYDIYLYKSKLPQTAGSNTVTLFNYVQIKSQDDLLNSDGTAKTNLGGSTAVYSNDKFVEFKITLYGAAIKDDASLTEGLDTIVTSDISDINMDNLASITATKDSQKIAVALAKLLKDLPTN